MIETMEGDPKTFLAQATLIEMSLYTGKHDGIDGPLTQSAIAAAVTLAKSQKAARAKDLTNTIAERMVAAALTKVGLRETSKNQGPGIAELWTATTYPTGYAHREPYCAAFVCWALAKGAEGVKHPLALLRSPVAYDVEKWAVSQAKHGVELLDPKTSKPRPGDIATLRHASHVLIVVKCEGNTVYTVEGNTDSGGSREGDGFYTRTRARNALRKLIRINR